MSDVERPSELVHRLHRLRVQRGLTIQQMAEQCGVPKSSLESYMKISGAKRPGVEALTAIADGMKVSLDWLVGRAPDSFPPQVSQKDFALACFGVVQGLIGWMRETQARTDGTIFGPDTVAGVSDAEVAAKAMLDFVERMQVFAATADQAGAERSALFDALAARQPATE